VLEPTLASGAPGRIVSDQRTDQQFSEGDRWISGSTGNRPGSVIRPSRFTVDVRVSPAPTRQSQTIIDHRGHVLPQTIRVNESAVTPAGPIWPGTEVDGSAGSDHGLLSGARKAEVLESVDFGPSRDSR